MAGTPLRIPGVIISPVLVAVIHSLIFIIEIMTRTETMDRIRIEASEYLHFRESDVLVIYGNLIANEPSYYSKTWTHCAFIITNEVYLFYNS